MGPPRLLHVRIYAWLYLPCWALGSPGLPKASRAKEITFSTSREAQLLQD